MILISILWQALRFISPSVQEPRTNTPQGTSRSMGQTQHQYDSILFITDGTKEANLRNNEMTHIMKWKNCCFKRESNTCIIRNMNGIDEEINYLKYLDNVDIHGTGLT
jgi:hypothetical protein